MVDYTTINLYKIPNQGVFKDWNSEWYKKEEISEEIKIDPESPIRRIGKVKKMGWRKIRSIEK